MADDVEERRADRIHAIELAELATIPALHILRKEPTIGRAFAFADGACAHAGDDARTPIDGQGRARHQSSPAGVFASTLAARERNASPVIPRTSVIVSVIVRFVVLSCLSEIADASVTLNEALLNADLNIV